MTNTNKTVAIAMTWTAGIDRTGIDNVKTITPTAEQLDQFISDLDDIIEDIAEINQNMALMDEDLVGLGEDIKQFSQTMARLNSYQLPRLNNTNAVDEDFVLTPLYGVNNNVIDSFPLTLRDLNALEDAGIDVLLQELGVPVAAGTELAAKKRMFRCYIGAP
ncbi:hypothetical protein B9Z19DRAFT_1088622 [Tuber borchii]|uniref:Uncharacterized protein n=1 Tax=Tuber borchii TaxID=42251 RepID=A0A2T6ZLA5_TUBBO|nr:hypothetical protein B9Z19DRAFT_1088622 [Tuber borchii]